MKFLLNSNEALHIQALGSVLQMLRIPSMISQLHEY